jgi:uncharacterized UPF0146 family protein
MLAELIEYALTRCPPYARRMGYLYEAIAIRARASRCGAAWAPHQERTRSLIHKAIARCKQRRKVIVLGSGPLLDVPLTELAATFGEVVLVDVVHPVTTAWRRRRFANVQTVTADVTGVVEEVYRVARDANATLPRAEPDLFCNDADVDLVLSVNLMSQLPYLPVEYLTKADVHPTEAIESFGHDLVSAHVRYLRRVPGVAMLVADVESQTVDAKGAVIDREDTLYGATPPKADEEWIWQLAPRPEAHRQFSYHRRVIGVVDVKTIG